MKKITILIFILTFQLSITNCNLLNNEKSSSTLNREKMQIDLNKNILEKKMLLKKTQKQIQLIKKKK